MLLYLWLVKETLLLMVYWLHVMLHLIMTWPTWLWYQCNIVLIWWSGSFGEKDGIQGYVNIIKSLGRYIMPNKYIFGENNFVNSGQWFNGKLPNWCKQIRNNGLDLYFSFHSLLCRLICCLIVFWEFITIFKLDHVLVHRFKSINIIFWKDCNVVKSWPELMFNVQN